MNHIQDSIQELDSVGFTVLPQVISEPDCHALGETMLSLLNQGNSAIASAGRIVGGRNLLEQWDGWRDIVTLPLVSQFVGEVVGSEAGIVRILYFDKPPGKGWSLAVHKGLPSLNTLHPSSPFETNPKQVSARLQTMLNCTWTRCTKKTVHLWFTPACGIGEHSIASELTSCAT